GGSPVRRAARHRPPGRLMMAATAAAVAVSLAVAVAGTTSAARRDRSDGSPAASARQFLLAAASFAARRPQRTGRYWHVLIHESYDTPVEASGVRFTVTLEDRQESWTSAASRADDTDIYQSLGFRPATAADEAAWRRAGSPGTVWIPGAPPARLPMAPGPVQVSSGERIWPGGLNMRDVQDLPSGQAMLKARLLQAGEHIGAPTRLPAPDLGRYRLFEVAAVLFRSAPLSPAVTAAVFRILAGLPGITKISNVRDGEGRSGSAVAMVVRAAGGGTVLSRLILDPATGNIRGDSEVVITPFPGLPWLQPGDLFSDHTVVAQGWTGTAPKSS
ncbi:MAG: CU044_5270 family protein, partial [Streptosporangiaceae bacterium]|nr:CU044_5270 family protein [Streptosporangiaceae bacterium]